MDRLSTNYPFFIFNKLIIKKGTIPLFIGLLFLMCFSSNINSQTSQIITFNSVDPPAGFVAFPPAPGASGVEDYEMETAGLHNTDSVLIDSLIFVGGVASSDGLGGEIIFGFFNEDTVFIDEFSIGLPQDGAFLWTIFAPFDFKIPPNGFLQIFVDTTAAANVGRGVGGQWFLSTEANLTNMVGSSPGNIFGVPDDAGNPRIFAFTLFTSTIPIHNGTMDACTTADGPITSTSNDAYLPIFQAGELLASINDAGGNLGQVDADFYISSTDRVDAVGAHYLNRSLFIDPGTNGPATVRFYIPDSELQALITASAGDANPIATVDDLMVTKVDGVTCGATSAGSGGGTASLIAPSAAGSYGTDWYIDIPVTGFSGFSVGGGDAVLPVELSSFEIAEKENGFQLNWTTASELNNQGFEIERSTDGERFENIGFVSGLGTSNEENQYTFGDKAVLKNMDYYYRLKQINYDGRSEYSNILTGIILESKALSISELMPNPAFGKTSFNVSLLKDENLSVEVFDLSGKLYSSVNYQLSSGFQTVDLDLSNLSKGNYLVRVVSQNETQIKKLIIH